MDSHIRFDWAMKRILCDKANFDVLEGFLSVLLGEQVLISELLESEGNKEDALDKFNRVDILAKDSRGELLLVEVQNESEHDYFHRMNYGQAKLISEHLHEKDGYGSVKRVVSINIVYFDLGRGQDYLYEGRTEFRGVNRGDVLGLSRSQRQRYRLPGVWSIFARYFIIKVNSFDDQARTPIDEWIYFLKHNEIPDGFTAQGLAQAKEKLRKASLTGPEKVSYDLFVKQRRIQQGVIETAFVEAEDIFHDQLEKAQAKAQAKAQEAEQKAREAEQKAREERQLKQKAEQKAREAEAKLRRSARAMLRLGLPPEAVMESLGLSREELRRIAERDED